jgi:uncharacterized membrane protein
MENIPIQPDRLAKFYPILKMLLIFTTGLVLLGWWLNTPPGLLGKADAAGYAVCHRIASRSFLIGDRQTPLCARCSGMYLGALLGILYLTPFGRRSGMPALKISMVLVAFLGAFGVDGLNSYLHFFPGVTGVYQPENWLRLVTGTGVGLGIAAVLVPVVHQVFWQNNDKRPALAGWRQFLPLISLAGLLDLAVLSDIPLLLYPLALLSAATIFLVLTMVYTVVWILVFKRENRFQRYQELWVPLLAGFLMALMQIGVFDAIRFWLTHTWAGFQL